jgi:hypothetical protein
MLRLFISNTYMKIATPLRHLNPQVGTPFKVKFDVFRLFKRAKNGTLTCLPLSDLGRNWGKLPSHCLSLFWIPCKVPESFGSRISATAPRILAKVRSSRASFFESDDYLMNDESPGLLRRENTPRIAFLPCGAGGLAYPRASAQSSKQRRRARDQCPVLFSIRWRIF